MHTPDGLLDHPLSVGTAVVAAGCVSVALRRARVELTAPNPDGSPANRVGRVATVAAVGSLIFAGQLVNFPVAHGLLSPPAQASDPQPPNG